MVTDLCGQQVLIDGAPFICNLAPGHTVCGLCRHPWSRHTRMGCQDCKVCITPDHLGLEADLHQAQGDFPVRFTLRWREHER